MPVQGSQEVCPGVVDPVGGNEKGGASFLKLLLSRLDLISRPCIGPKKSRQLAGFRNSLWSPRLGGTCCR